MSGTNEMQHGTWTPRDTVVCTRLLAFLLRVCVAALCGYALGWGLKGGWTDAAAWWHWGVIGASAAAIWAVYRGTFFTLRGPLEACLGFVLGAACFVLLGMFASASSGLPQTALGFAVIIGCALAVGIALFGGVAKTGPRRHFSGRRREQENRR